MTEQELSLEQVAGKFAGFVNYTKDKSEEEVAEALSKQPEYIVSMYNAIHKKEEPSFSFEGNTPNSTPTPSQGDPEPIVKQTETPPPAIDKEELYKEFISRYSQETQTKTVEQTKSEATKIAGDFFSQYTDQAQKQKDMLMVRNYVAGSVANGDDYVKATKDALELIAPKQIQIRGTEQNQNASIDTSGMSFNELQLLAQAEEFKKWG